MAELGVAYISVIPDTSKIAPAIKGATDTAATQSGTESGKTFGSRFSGAVGGALKTAGKAGLIGAGVAAGATILSGVKSAVSQDKAEATLTGLYGSAKTASKLMKDLKKVASTSTIDYSTYTETAQALAYLGVSGKDAPKMLENIGDAISGAGGGASEMDRAGDALLKMVNAGKVELGTLNQLSDTGVPIYSALAEQQGKSIANVRKMVTAGKIGIDDVQKAIADAEGASFKKQIASAKQVEKTLSGRFAILKDNVVSSLGTMFRPGIDAAADFVGQLNKTIFEGGGGGLTKRLGSIFSGVDFSQFVKTGGALKDFFVGLYPAVRNVAGQFKDALGPALRTLADSFTTNILPAFRALLTVARPVLSFIIRMVGGALVGAFKGAVQVISGAMQVIGGLFRFFKALITGQWGAAWDALKGIASGVMDVIVGAIKVWWNLGIVAVFRRGILLVLKPFGKMFARLFGLAKAGIKKVTGALRPIVAFIRKVLGATFRWLWRKAVQPAFRGIGRLAGWLWNKALAPAFRGIGRVVGWLWNKAIQPAFSAIRKGTGVLWKGVKFYFTAWKTFFTGVLFPVIRFLWSKVAKPVFNQVGKLIGWLWNKVAKPLFGAWKTFFTGVLFPAISRLWSGVVKPVFNRVGTIIGWLWNKVAKPAFDGLRKGFGKVGDVISSVWNNVLKPPLDAFKKILDTIKDSIGWVLNKAGDLKDLPGSIFGGIKGGASKLKFWATGGPVFGPGSSTSDSVPAMLSNGEHVWTAREVRAAGGHRAVAQLRAAMVNGSIPALATGGPAVPIAAVRASGNRATLTAELRALIGVLRRQVVPALLKSTTRPAPRAATRTRRTTGSGGATQFMQGLDGTGTGSRNPRVLDGFTKSLKRKVIPTLDGFTKGQKKAKRETVGMELAVGKSTKKLGRYWTRLRQGPLKAFSKDWTRRIGKTAVADGDALAKSTGRTTKRLGTTLASFRKGPLSGFTNDWRKQFRTNTPADVDTFRSKTANLMGRTRDNIRAVWSNGIRPTMQTFGQYPRKTVAPAFAKGVDAVGAAWSKVEPKTAAPIRYVVNTVLNKGLIAAFNKIAKFVDHDTIKTIGLPKGFRTGGYTGAGGKYQPAGIVHAGEYVINRDSTARLQRSRPGLLDDLNSRGNDRRMRPPHDRNKWRLPGYWTGGGVLPLPSATSISKHGTPYYGAWYASDMNGPYDGTLAAKIISWKDGRVAYTKASNSSYGYETVINHPDGNFTRYAHQLPGSQRVRGGQSIRRGQHIGAVGETGNAQGAHLHFEIKGGKESQILGLGPGGSGLPGWAQKIVDAPKKWATKLLDGGKELASPFGQLAQAALDNLIGPSAGWAEDQLGTMAYSGPMTGSVTRFTPLVKKALKMLGASAGGTLVGAVLARMQQESGGNVGIVNKWDSNWQAGHPSVGLMQVIGPTYQSYKHRPDKGPYKYGTSIDPFSNIFAGLNYAKHAYGSIYEAMVKSGGYDSGGLANGVGFLPKRTIEPERVLSPRHTIAFERMVARNFTPSAPALDGPVELTITNWETGKAVMRRNAAAEIGSQRAHARTVGRQLR